MDSPKDPGETFLDGKLEVLRVLGVGGMGTVYEVRHTLTKHRRALKVIRPRATNATIIKRFEQEASVAGTLNSPYITDIYDAGQLEDGGFYVLMEMLEGESLREYLGRIGKIESGPACAIVEEMCRGLRVAHEAGIIHRDLKPENVFLVDGDGPRVKLIDFGISKFENAEAITAAATETGAILGTPLYMSPEQLKSSRDVDPLTDLYAVGVMLYEMLSGVRPYQADSLPTLLVNIYMGERLALSEREPDLPDGLAAIVEKAMHLQASERFASIAELEAAIAPFASELRLVPRGASISPIAFLPTAATDENDIPHTVVSEVAPHTPEPTKHRVAMMMLVITLVAAGVFWALTRSSDPVAPVPEPEAETTTEVELPRGHDVPPVEVGAEHMEPVEAVDDMQPVKVRMVRPSERDGLMRPSYGMPR